jgi:hypothetical protein
LQKLQQDGDFLRQDGKTFSRTSKNSAGRVVAGILGFGNEIAEKVEKVFNENK